MITIEKLDTDNGEEEQLDEVGDDIKEEVEKVLNHNENELIDEEPNSTVIDEEYIQTGEDNSNIKRGKVNHR